MITIIFIIQYTKWDLRELFTPSNESCCQEATMREILFKNRKKRFTKMLKLVQPAGIEPALQD